MNALTRIVGTGPAKKFTPHLGIKECSQMAIATAPTRSGTRAAPFVGRTTHQYERDTLPA